MTLTPKYHNRPTVIKTTKNIWTDVIKVYLTHEELIQRFLTERLSFKQSPKDLGFFYVLTPPSLWVHMFSHESSAFVQCTTWTRSNLTTEPTAQWLGNVD